MRAAYNGQVEVARLLLDVSADKAQGLKASKNNMWTALKKPYSKILDKRKLLGLEMSFKSSFRSGPPADYGDTARQR